MPRENATNTFRCRGKCFFITYAQCPADHQEIFEFIKSKNGAYTCVAKELHEDGNTHYHAFVKFQSRRELGPRFFDFRSYHPNVQAARNPAASLTYVKKDGEFLEHGTNELDVESNDVPDPTSFQSEFAFLNECHKRKIPYGYAQRFWALANASDAAYTIRDGPTDEQYTSRVCRNLQTFDFDWEGCPKSLILEGPAGCGKTEWAKYKLPKPILFVRHLDLLRHYNPSIHKSILFDDMNFDHLPRSTWIFLLDRENPQQVHVRYGVAQIPSMVPKCFTTNVDMFGSRSSDNAIGRRIQYNKIIL